MKLLIFFAALFVSSYAVLLAAILATYVIEAWMCRRPRRRKKNR